jgi:hypothetical protein
MLRFPAIETALPCKESFEIFDKLIFRLGLECWFDFPNPVKRGGTATSSHPFLKLSSNIFYRECIYIIIDWQTVFCQTYHSAAAHLLSRNLLQNAEIFDPVFTD